MARRWVAWRGGGCEHRRTPALPLGLHGGIWLSTITRCAEETTEDDKKTVWVFCLRAAQIVIEVAAWLHHVFMRAAVVDLTWMWLHEHIDLNSQT